MDSFGVDLPSLNVALPAPTLVTIILPVWQTALALFLASGLVLSCAVLVRVAFRVIEKAKESLRKNKNFGTKETNTELTEVHMEDPQKSFTPIPTPRGLRPLAPREQRDDGRSESQFSEIELA